MSNERMYYWWGDTKAWNIIVTGTVGDLLITLYEYDREDKALINETVKVMRLDGLKEYSPELGEFISEYEETE